MEVKLPGVGVRHEFSTESGESIGVVVRHDGRREVVVYDRSDPDACSSVLDLSHDDARTLTELLGASQVSEEVAEAQHDLDGSSISWITIPGTSRAAGASIEAGRYRSKTGASIVAVIRDGVPVATPSPEFILMQGDVVVAVGSTGAVDLLRESLEGTP